jgi:hypothetical protein
LAAVEKKLESDATIPLQIQHLHPVRLVCVCVVVLRTEVEKRYHNQIMLIAKPKMTALMTLMAMRMKMIDMIVPCMPVRIMKVVMSMHMIPTTEVATLTHTTHMMMKILRIAPLLNVPQSVVVAKVL